jgi:ATP-dependent Clp protease ATP-binding subunit ClpB
LAKEDEKFTREALLKQGVKYNDLMQAVQKIREKNGPVISRGAEAMYEALLKYGIDFTERAREGKLDPVIGRDDEIRRAIQILSRRTKNNPVLIGDPGVGKVGSRMLAREGLLGVYETLDLTLYFVIDRRRLRKVSPSE